MSRLRYPLLPPPDFPFKRGRMCKTYLYKPHKSEGNDLRDPRSVQRYTLCTVIFIRRFQFGIALKRYLETTRKRGRSHRPSMRHSSDQYEIYGCSQSFRQLKLSVHFPGEHHRRINSRCSPFTRYRRVTYSVRHADAVVEQSACLPVPCNLQCSLLPFMLYRSHTFCRYLLRPTPDPSYTSSIHLIGQS